MDEQNNHRVTYHDLIKNIRHHDLIIDGEVYGDRYIKMFGLQGKQAEDFYGSIPDDYSKSLKIKNDELFPLFKKDQRIFLKPATSHISSGNFIIATKGNKIRIVQYRTFNGNIYLLPLAKRDAGISNNTFDKYIFKNQQDWTIEYVIII
jgi:hypothetical protein